MEFDIIPDEEALGRCAWCESRINDTMEVFGLGAKLKPDIDLSDYESHCIDRPGFQRKVRLHDGNGSGFGSQK